jgi:hypothetical protein
VKLEKASALSMDLAAWEKFLQTASEYEEVYFVQKGQIPDHRDQRALQKFSAKRPYGVAILEPTNRSYEFSIRNLEEKNQTLEQMEEILKRDSGLEPKTEKIISIAEEIILNALVSAPAVAAEAGRPTQQASCLFSFEWNEQEIWLHGQDPHGSFTRGNFQRSFRPINSSKIPTHGHSGRGLEIILNACTDLYIQSRSGWGTWVAARVDLVLTNRENDISPKRLLLDFK